MHGRLHGRPDSTCNPGEAQVSDSIGYFSEYDNVEDFIEHYLIRMADKYAAHGRDDIADALYDALERYMTHEVGIQLVQGQVYLIPLDNTEEIDDDIDTA